MDKDLGPLMNEEARMPWTPCSRCGEETDDNDPIEIDGEVVCDVCAGKLQHLHIKI